MGVIKGDARSLGCSSYRLERFVAWGLGFRFRVPGGWSFSLRASRVQQLWI